MPSFDAVAGEVHAVDRKAFNDAFDDAYSRYALPGLAVGIVVDGEVVYTRTQGELAAGEGETIDASSIFKIASNSKSMTTALLARLVEQGRLRWEDPVVKHLPHFRMHDDWVTGEMQVRDLLIHNSGLGPGAGDLMLWPEPNLFTREDVIRGLRYLKPIYSFRSRYAYDNSLYIVAGEVAAAAGGAPFDVLVRREVFQPLGMARCQAGQWRRDNVGHVAQPHMRHEGGNIVIRRDGETIPDVPMMAAGGIRCSLGDMLAWMQAWLQPEGDILDQDGGTWLSQRQRDELWKTHMPMPLSRQMREWDGSHFSAYGYGWRLTDVDGTWKVSHTGTLAGMYSAVTLLPEKRVGIVFMANGEAGEARTALSQALVKQFTSPDASRHTVAHYAGLLASSRVAGATVEDDAGQQSAPEQVRRMATTAEASGALGRFRDPWFGEIEVCPAGEGVRFRSLKSPKLTGDLILVGSRLLVDWHDVDVDVEAWLDPVPGEAGTQGLRMAKIDPRADFSYDFEDLAFARIGDCAGE
ncbi:MAG: beta-lactamase family protein [Luteimonas sp.]|nr:beta-lactamase family protein [Luteimonas sp.]